MKIKIGLLMFMIFTYSLVFGQVVDGGTYPGICPGGQSITLTGTIVSMPADADDYCVRWIEPGGSSTDGFTITVTPAATTTYTFEVIFNNGDIATDDVTIAVCNIEIHPVTADFNAANAGKVMIWTGATDNNYWTTEKTTKADKPAQSEDHLVHVTVHLTPAADFVGRTVYFKVVNPDLDDESSYEIGGATGDNLDMGVVSGTLNVASDMTTLEMIDGNSVAAAEVELTITSRYSGDNYQVEASLDATFADPAQTLKTSKLVAWERVYVEEDKMYKKGATITTTIVLDGDAVDDVIDVDDTNDFSVGDMIQLFDNAGVVANKSVKGKTATTLTVEDMGVSFVKYSGVRIDGQNAIYSIGTGLFTNGFGGDAVGTDGGTFVEFDWGYSGSQSTPKYTEFPSDGYVTAFEYGEYWFQNSGGGNNIFQLIAAADDANGSYGVSVAAKNICFAFVDVFTFGANNPAAITETAVHEFGHLLNVANLHVDASIGTSNHAGTDMCNMSYDRVRDNSIVEFDTDCLYDIRKTMVPR